jgi:HSP20 family protein
MDHIPMEHRRIREVRGHLGLSQERFAQRLGVSLQTVWRWENGLTRPLPIIGLKLDELQREAMAARPRVEGIPRAGGIPTRGGIPVLPGKESRRGDAGVELGLGGLFRGIGSLLDLVSRMAEEGAEEASRTGEVKALGGKLQGVYGFSVRLGLGGRPVIQQFGNIRDAQGGAVVTETREPLVDVLEEEDQLSVIAEIPGVEEQDVVLHLEGDVLEIAATAQDRKYWKEVLLPWAVDPEPVHSSCRNGVLEVKYHKASV